MTAAPSLTPREAMIDEAVRLAVADYRAGREMTVRTVRMNFRVLCHMQLIGGRP